MNYYRRYIGDYGRDTSLLSLVEHGAYCVLLDHYYAAEEALPLDREDVYRLARAVKPEERRAVDKVLAKYFSEEPDGFHNSRADAELTRATPAIEAARENGKKGGRPRGEGKPTGLAIQQTHGDTQDEPDGKAIRAGDPTTNHQPPPANLQPTSKASARGTRLPPLWIPGDDLQVWTRGERPGWDYNRYRMVLESFRDYWAGKPGKDGVKLDWDATWRNWVRKEPDGPASPKAMPLHTLSDQEIERRAIALGVDTRGKSRPEVVAKIREREGVGA